MKKLAATLLVLTATMPVRAQEDPHFAGEVEVPAIARYLHLPMRMMSEVSVDPGKYEIVLTEGMVEYFDRVLRTSTEVALQAEAARSLARIAQGDHGDIAVAVSALEDKLSTDDRGLRFAAVRALVAADAASSGNKLLKLCAIADDRLRMAIEPALAEWELADAAPMWRDRVSKRAESTVSLRLACEGLAKIGSADDAAPLRSLVEDPLAAFASRHAAARALTELTPDVAAETAAAFVEGGVRDRLLAVELLSGTHREGWSTLRDLCSDPVSGVAARAWTALEQRDPELLRPLVAQGRQHADSLVRLAAIATMRRFPSAEHAAWLFELLADVHIVVRNRAREALIEYARSDEQLSQQIVQLATGGLESNWQQIEQCLLVAATLKQTQFTPLCVRLLEHPRPEVFVTAAWLMHLYPDALVMPEVERIARKGRQLSNNRPVVHTEDVSLFMAHLFQLAGYTNYKPMQSLCEVHFRKETGLSAPGRAAAIWAIGMVNRGNPEPSLVTRLVGRLNDRSSIIPEVDPVRRMAVMSLGRMKAETQVAQVLNAYEVDEVASLIPAAARWALEELGSEVPPERVMRDGTGNVGGWRLSPIPVDDP